MANRYEVVGNFWGEGERIYAFEGLLCLLVPLYAQSNSPD